MKQLFLNFLRPYVLQIIKEHLVVIKTEQPLKETVVSDVIIDDKPKPPPDPIPPIIP
jgi:hypothetical protein